MFFKNEMRQPKSVDAFRETGAFNPLANQGCFKIPDFSLSSIGWRRVSGRVGAFLLVPPLLGPLPREARA